MDSTSVSLLNRVRNADDDLSWQRFVDLYTPMIYRWATGIGLPQTEATDLVQDVFVRIVKQMPTFQYDRNKSFRSWLKTVTTNRARDFLRQRAQRPVPGSMHGQPPSLPDSIEFLSAQEYNAMLTRRALEIMQSDFEETTWQACWQVVVEGHSTAEVAASLGITKNAVYLAKSHILRRLRQEMQELLE